MIQSFAGNISCLFLAAFPSDQALQELVLSPQETEAVPPQVAFVSFFIRVDLS
jgi:hypothetical protein